MTENEAINGLETLKYQCKYNGECGSCNICCSAIPLAIESIEEIQQYRAIGTIEELQALKEKSVAKKPIETMMCYKAVWKCPTCSSRLYSGQPHCEECGQAILDDYEDWQ